jgi:hypothetical protein
VTLQELAGTTEYWSFGIELQTRFHLGISPPDRAFRAFQEMLEELAASPRYSTPPLRTVLTRLQNDPEFVKCAKGIS